MVFGWKEVVTAKQDIQESCVACKKSFSLTLFVLHNYIHVYYIPLFPIEKIVKTQCTSCGFILLKKEMPESLLLSYRNMKGRNRIPIWMFSGVLAVLLAIGSVVLHNKITATDSQLMIRNPHKNDLYYVKLGKGSYTTYKVKKVFGDSASILMNKFVTDKASGVYEIQDMEYNDTAVTVHKSRLEELYNTKEILEVRRNLPSIIPNSIAQ